MFFIIRLITLLILILNIIFYSSANERVLSLVKLFCTWYLIFLEYSQCLLCVSNFVNFCSDLNSHSFFFKFSFFSFLKTLSSNKYDGSFSLASFCCKTFFLILLAFNCFNHPLLPNVLADSNWDQNFFKSSWSIYFLFCLFALKSCLPLEFILN